MHTAALHAALEGGVPRAVLATISDMRADGFVPNISLYNKVRVVGKARGNVKDAFVKVRKKINSRTKCHFLLACKEEARSQILKKNNTLISDDCAEGVIRGPPPRFSCSNYRVASWVGSDCGVAFRG